MYIIYVARNGKKREKTRMPMNYTAYPNIVSEYSVRKTSFLVQMVQEVTGIFRNKNPKISLIFPK